MILGSLDDLDFPGGTGDGLGQLRAAIGTVGKDCLREGKQPAGALIKYQHGAIAILYRGRMDHRREHQTKGIDQQMALLTFDLFARIVARRVDREPPFSVLFTLWLSIAPAEGEASRPSRSRAMT